MAIVDRFLDLAALLFKWLATGCLAVMVAINSFNIVWRGIFDHAFGWVFGWTLLLFVWMLLLGFFAYVRDRRDVQVDIFMTRLPRPARKVMGIFAALVGALVMVAILRAAPQLLALQTARMDTIDLPIYARSAPLFVSAALVLVHFLNLIVSILRGREAPFESPDEPVIEGAVE